MITGDNIYTGISIAMQTNIIQKDKNIWVGEFKVKKDKVKWTFFKNNEISNMKQDKLLKEESYKNDLTSVDQTSKLSSNKSIILKSLITRIHKKQKFAKIFE